MPGAAHAPPGGDHAPPAADHAPPTADSPPPGGAAADPSPPPDIRPPPPFAPEAPRVPALVEDDWLKLLRTALSDPAAVAHSLRAHALAAAEHFEDLLSLAGLHGVESHSYQIETVRRVLRTLRGRALLADEVGLGKTIEALMILREYQLRGMVRRALILSPAPLVPHWAGELIEKAGLSVRTTDDPQSRLDPAAFWGADGVIVASLALARRAQHAELIKDPGRPWDMVIVDEAHHVKNRTTLGAKLVNGLKSRFLLLLTATPVENDLEELYNLVTLLKPGQFATAADFRKQYVDTKNPTSPKNRERLRALLGEVMIRNTRAQSGLRLPPRFVTTMAVDPTDTERRLYDGIVRLLREHGTEHGTRLAASTLLLMAGSSAHAARGSLQRMLQGERHSPAFRDGARALLDLPPPELADTRKAHALLEVLRLHEGEQVLVFSRFRETLTHITARLDSARVPHVTFHGGMDGPAKQAALGAFRDGTRVLVASDAGGEGQNLQFCHVLVNFDLPWNPMLIEQRIGRLHRMGQTQEVRVYNLCARGTVEERVLDVLDRRLHLFELVVGEMDMVLGNMSDERDLEERILDLYARSRSEDEVAQGFDALYNEMLQARQRYERTRALDEALFGEDFEA